MPAAITNSSDALSQARYLFELYTGPGAVALLQSLPAQIPKVFETEWLDFKTGKFNPQDVPRIWSKALGAFANNEGGVVVWGVDATRSWRLRHRRRLAGCPCKAMDFRLILRSSFV